MLVEINLLPLEFRGKVKSDKKRLNLQLPRFAPYVIVGGILFAAVIAFAVISYASALKNNLAAAKRILRQEQTRAAQATTVSTDLPNLEERSFLLSERVGSKIIWWEILDQVARCCPSDAVLKSVKIEYDSSMKIPNMLVLSGSYDNGSGIELTYTRNLQSSTRLAQYIENIYPGQTTVVENKTLFTVKCQFKMAEKPVKTEEKKEKNSVNRKSAKEKE